MKVFVFDLLAYGENLDHPKAGRASLAPQQHIGKDCQLWWKRLTIGKIAMPTRNINLTDEQDAFVEKLVKAGKYQNASEAMRDAVRGLQRRWKEDELRLGILRKQLKAGIDALDNGEFTEIADADLDTTLDQLAAPKTS